MATPAEIDALNSEFGLAPSASTNTAPTQSVPPAQYGPPPPPDQPESTLDTSGMDAQYAAQQNAAKQLDPRTSDIPIARSVRAGGSEVDPIVALQRKREIDALNQEFGLRPSGTTDQKPSDILPKSSEAVQSLTPFVPGVTPFIPKSDTLFQRSPDKQYEQKTQEGDIPFDPNTGAGALLRLKLGVHRDRMQQLEILRDEYGQENIRMDKNGDFIARTTDDEGKLKDIKIDERNLTLRDFLDIASEYPALAFSLTTSAGKPVGSILKSSIEAALKYGIGGTAEDVAAGTLNRSENAPPVDLGEILSHRGTEAGWNAAFGAGLGKAVEFGLGAVPRIANFFSSRVQKFLTTNPKAMAEVNAAHEATKTFSGVDRPRSIAELTGNPVALRVETFAKNMPGARGVMLRHVAKQAEAEQAIQNVLTEGKTPAPRETGQGIMDILSGRLKDVQNKTVSAASTVRRKASEALTVPLSKISGAKISATEFAEKMIPRANAQLQAYKDKSREMFGAIRARFPDASERLFDTEPIKKTARELLKEIPPDFLDRPIPELAPSGIISKIQAIERLPEEYSYFELKDLRTSIYDLMDSPEPISSKGTSMLKRIASSITREMKETGKTVLKPETFSAIQTANKFVEDRIETFYEKGIRGLLTPKTESGSVVPEQVASKLISGGKGSVSFYNTIKDFFEGANKTEAVSDMNRLLRDSVIDAGTDSTGLIKLEDLSNSVSKMEPEIVQALFGKTKDELSLITQRAQLALKSSGLGNSVAFLDKQASVEADALKSLLSSKTSGIGDIRKLVNAQNDLKKAYASSVMSSVKENDVGVIAASPESFVENFLMNPKIPEADVKDALVKVFESGDATLIGDVRNVFLGNVFKNAAKKSGTGAEQALSRINQNSFRDIDAQKFAIELEDPAVTRRMELVLGKEKLDNLKNFAKSMAGSISSDPGAQLPGAIAGSKNFADIFKGNFHAMGSALKHIAIAFLMTSAKFSKIPYLPTSVTDAAVKAAMFSPEFAHAISTQSASPEEAKQLAEELKSWQQKQGQTK